MPRTRKQVPRGQLWFDFVDPSERLALARGRKRTGLASKRVSAGRKARSQKTFRFGKTAEELVALRAQRADKKKEGHWLFLRQLRLKALRTKRTAKKEKDDAAFYRKEYSGLSSEVLRQTLEARQRRFFELMRNKRFARACADLSLQMTVLRQLLAEKGIRVK